MRVAVREVGKLLIDIGTGIALILGTFGVFMIVVFGVREALQELSHSSDPLSGWLGLLLIICTGYAGFRLAKALTAGGDRDRYDKLYPVAIRLKETGQTLQDAMTRGSRGELLSAELHWHDAVTDLEAFRPQTGGS